MATTPTIRALFAAAALACVHGASAATPTEPVSRTAAVPASTELTAVALPAIDVQARLAEDAANTEPGGLRYAIPIDMSVTPKNDGTWETLANGDRLWRYRVYSEGATDLNFGFTRYRLPEGASLFVIGEDKDYFHGPYTSADNRAHGEHWTPMVPGAHGVIELRVPAKVFANDLAGLELELGRVGAGYRDLFGTPNLSRQGACNIDTICPEGDNWRDEIRSASQYSLGGSFFCSGTMIMDVPGSFRSWYLTADHCGLTAGNAPSLVVLWNFESAMCGDLSGGIASDVQTGGAVWRAARADADFTLLELTTVPDPSFGVYYSGWDATGSVPPSSVGISHPSNDEKALAFNDDALTTTNSCIGPTGVGNTHWNVDNYEEGMTEPGSSGSGIWNTYGPDPYNPVAKRLVGVLSGGSAACAGSVPNAGFDCYGKFSEAWAGGATASTRLSDWLDPNGTGTLIVDGADAIPAVCGDSMIGAGEQCDDGNTGGGDGCSASCQVEDGFTCINPPDGPSQCSLIECGNGLVEVGEQCDDGNDANGDGCSASCGVEDGFSCENPPGEPSMCEPVPEGCSEDVVAIPDANGSGVSSSITVANGGSMLDLDFSLVINHTWIGDLIVTLEHDDTGTSAVLLDRVGLPAINPTFGCGNANIDVTLDDEASTAAEDQCSASPPALGGTHTPNSPLSVFDGENAGGSWTLTVSDNAGQDTGSIISWCLEPTEAVADSDSDGVTDDADNCTNAANPLQVDSNGDGIGNVCDADIAGPGGAGSDDCQVNFFDLGQMKAVFFTTDADADLVGPGNSEPDGQVNFFDLGRMKEAFFGQPGPSATGCN
ncbi:MAG: DUF4215 domain-containing protein [Pseudomonadota bacterium]